jgi:hypothetical protein
MRKPTSVESGKPTFVLDGDLIRKKRRQMGLSLQDFVDASAKAGARISRNTLWTVERERGYKCLGNTRNGIARVLQMDPGDLELKHGLEERVEGTTASTNAGELLLSGAFRTHQIDARIHTAFALDFDYRIKNVFDALNHRRAAQDPPREPNYPATRFRLIRPPSTDGIRLRLDLAPMNFAHRAILVESPLDSLERQYVLEKAAAISARIPDELQSNDPHLNGNSCVPLGIEVVLITSDGYTLLRQRGIHVTTGKDEWDVAYSGYCGTPDVNHNDGMLNPALTVERELHEEIGTLAYDTRRIIFSGVHRNLSNGVIDLLAYWNIDATAGDVRRALTKDEQVSGTVFDTTERAPEAYVCDSRNALLRFNADAIRTFLDEGEPERTMMPEALSALDLALTWEGYEPVSGVTTSEKGV